MTRLAGQLALFGSQSVHVGHRSPVTGSLICVACKVSLVLAAGLDCCDHCPGLVESVPPWVRLGEGSGQPALELGEAA